MKYSIKQLMAVEKINRFIYENKGTSSYFKLGGYAGCGKTFIAKKIVDDIYSSQDLNVGTCAFTGKAAERLKSKGLDASTIHSLIYEYDKVKDKFFLKKSLPMIDYFLIDEASMISEKLWIDLKTFNKPFVLIGDPAQLEPVGKDIFLMDKPDFLLNEIFRQEKGNGIIDLATDTRNGKFKYRKDYQDVFWGISPLPDKTLLNADIIIVLTNKLRITLNKHIRKLKSYPQETPTQGDKIIILQNSKEFGLNNGEIYTIKELNEGKHHYFVVFEEMKTKEIPLLKNQFNNPKKIDGDFTYDVWADYAYAISCHKSQGSEWDKIIVFDCGNPHFVDKKRWRYTAITRAKEKLVYVC